MDDVIALVKKNKDGYLHELEEFLRIPSISGDPTKNNETRRCAEWTAANLKAAGVENVRLIETGGHPVVYGEHLHAKGKPTILIYGHYDVQPVDPLDAWKTPPFEPTIKDGNIYARGTADDKGKLFVFIKAVEAWLEVRKTLPINVKFFIEGEEECGSAHTDSFLEENKKLLACDAVCLSDTAWFAEGFPCIQTSLRGLCYMEVTVKGPDHDLHSGSFGGLVANPLNVLGRMVAKLQDENGRILIPGFYDDVLKPSKEELEGFKRLPFDENEMKRCAGVTKLWGEKEYTPLERIWARPTLDVNGIFGGFTGEGPKTVITTQGTAKISMRLVANQDPIKIAGMFEKYVKEIMPEGVSVDVKNFNNAYPVYFPPDNKFVKGAAVAVERAFGKKPTFIREGFSIPITASFLKILKAPSVLLALGLPDDNLHGPNEKFSLEHFYKGIEMSVHLLEEYANVV